MAKAKAIGLLGGLTWLSTVDYYSILCRKANERAGDRFYPTIHISSINMQEFVDNVTTGNHEGNIRLLVGEAQKLEAAGSECLAICSNTPHLYADEIAASIGIPLLHIADATANAIAAQGINRVALTGTRYTMAASFYAEKLRNRGIELLPLEELDFEWVSQTIFDELTHDKFLEPTRQGYLKLFERLGALGVEGVVLGCTEIPILLKDCISAIPMFDTLQIHCDEILRFVFDG